MPPLEQPLDLLTIAPHPDDAEISMGGTLVTCQRQCLRVGARVALHTHVPRQAMSARMGRRLGHSDSVELK